MRVGWLSDQGNADGSAGGAELTQKELKDAAPDGVEVVRCKPGKVVAGLDAYVIHNCVTYTLEDLDMAEPARMFKYMHDVWPHGDSQVRERVLRHATLVFCSPLQRDRMRLTGPVIPPPVRLDRFRPKTAKKPAEPGKSVSIGAWQNQAKGQQSLVEYAQANGGLDVYGPGVFAPTQPPIDYKGQLAYSHVPKTLSRYATFVHLPWALEPFGRGVVEAWAAGLELVVNGLVGARHFIESEPDKLDTAAQDFWALVTST